MTTGLTRGAIGVALEKAVRPFIERGARQVPARVPAVQDKPEALLEFSARMSVQVTTIEATGIRIVWPDGSADHREVARQTRTVRVENPSDPNQFVDVEDIQTIDFENAGRRSRYRLRP